MVFLFLNEAKAEILPLISCEVQAADLCFPSLGLQA